MAELVVKSGKYRGFKLTELQEAETKYKAAVKQRDDMQVAAGGGLISQGDAGGSNVTFAHTAAYLSEWRKALDDAFSQIDASAEVYETDKFQVKFTS